jgi:hypothetical protein
MWGNFVESKLSELDDRGKPRHRLEDLLSPQYLRDISPRVDDIRDYYAKYGGLHGGFGSGLKRKG